VPRQDAIRLVEPGPLACVEEDVPLPELHDVSGAARDQLGVPPAKDDEGRQRHQPLDLPDLGRRRLQMVAALVGEGLEEMAGAVVEAPVLP